MWTRPLRKLTPQTSYGYAVIHFAAVVLGTPLDPWQQWVVIHLGELLPDGRPRFRQVLVLVARQNGKTHLCKVLALFWMFVERHPMIFGTSTDLEQAKEAWEAAVALAEDTPALAGRLNARHKRIGNGQQDFWTTDRIPVQDRRGRP
jgi:phage terminase large subunit-like protein